MLNRSRSRIRRLANPKGRAPGPGRSGRGGRRPVRDPGGGQQRPIAAPGGGREGAGRISTSPRSARNPTSIGSPKGRHLGRTVRSGGLAGDGETGRSRCRERVGQEGGRSSRESPRGTSRGKAGPAAPSDARLPDHFGARGRGGPGVRTRRPSGEDRRSRGRRVGDRGLAIQRDEAQDPEGQA